MANRFLRYAARRAAAAECRRYVFGLGTRSRSDDQRRCSFTLRLGGLIGIEIRIAETNQLVARGEPRCNRRNVTIVEAEGTTSAREPRDLAIIGEQWLRRDRSAPARWAQD